MWLLVIILLVVIAGLAWLVFAWRRDALLVRLEGEEFYESLQAKDPNNPMAGMDHQEFLNLYERAYRVRKPKYTLLYLAIATTGTAPVLMLMAMLRRYLYFGPIFWGFEIFFALILWWVAALWIALRIYYGRQPGTLDEEFKRLRN